MAFLSRCLSLEVYKTYALSVVVVVDDDDDIVVVVIIIIVALLYNPRG